MKILLMPSSYPPVLGGVQTVVEKLAQGLLQQGHEVRVVTNQYPRSLAGREIKEGVEIHRYLFLRPDFNDLRRGRWDLFLASFYFYPATLFGLNRIFKEFQPEVVNVHYPDAQIYFILQLRKKYRFRLIVSLHGHEVEGYKDFFESKRQLLRIILREADAVTACSHYLLNKTIQIEPSIQSKGKAIHNGVDSERFENKTPYRHHRPYLFAFGRLTYQKGFDLLLEAFAAIAGRYGDMDLIIAGEGEERGSLIKIIQRLNLEKRVKLYGRANSEEVVALLNGCEFCVVPSRFESFGITALEAMAAGKYVLAARVGGLPEFLGNTISQLVEPSAEALAKGMEQCLKELVQIQKAAKNNRQIAMERNWSKVIGQYEEVYRHG